MPRPIWKGSISFGLVNIPVGLYTAAERDTLRFRQIDRRSRAPVRQKRVSEATEEEVPWTDVVKGYEDRPGHFVLLDDEDFLRANVKATQTIEIVQFSPAEQITPAFFETPYFVAPDKAGVKGYALLRETLRRAGLAGIAKVVIRSRQHVAALLPQDGVMVLELLRYAHELRDPAELEVPGAEAEQLGVSQKELELAATLVDAMREPWRPEAFRDEYRDDLLKLIEQKAAGAGEAAEAAVVQPAAAEIVDIMSLLKRSVEEAGARAGGPSARRRRRKAA